MNKSNLKAYLNHSSLRHALWRNAELEILKTMEYVDPVLDVACGDGFLGSRLFGRNKVVGFDLSFTDIKEAKDQGNGYISLLLADVRFLPLKDRTFRTIFSNSVFEHLPDVEKALSEVSRVLSDNAESRFIFSVPNEKFSEYLFIASFLKKMGFAYLSKRYQEKINLFLKHINLNPLDVWSKRLERTGLKIERVIYYLPKAMVYIWDILFLPAYFSDCFYKLCGKRIKLPLRKSIGIFLANLLKQRRRINSDCAAMVIVAKRA